MTADACSPKGLGRRLRAIRHRGGWSQQELAGLVGVGVNTVGVWERRGVSENASYKITKWLVAQEAELPLSPALRTRRLPRQSRRPALLPEDAPAAAAFNANVRAAWCQTALFLQAYLVQHHQRCWFPNKRQLVLHAADVATYGALPPCPVCDGQSLRPDPYKRTITCLAKYVSDVREVCGATFDYDAPAIIRTPVPPIPRRVQQTWVPVARAQPLDQELVDMARQLAGDAPGAPWTEQLQERPHMPPAVEPMVAPATPAHQLRPGGRNPMRSSSAP